jgi:hypothetical protein
VNCDPARSGSCSVLIPSDFGAKSKVRGLRERAVRGLLPGLRVLHCRRAPGDAGPLLDRLPARSGYSRIPPLLLLLYCLNYCTR